MLLAYVAAYAVDLSLLALDPRNFGQPWRWAAGLGGRLALCIVVVAALAHGLRGLDVTVADLSPRYARREGGRRFVVQFLTAGLALPGCLLVLAPWFWRGTA